MDEIVDGTKPSDMKTATSLSISLVLYSFLVARPQQGPEKGILTNVCTRAKFNGPYTYNSLAYVRRKFVLTNIEIVRRPRPKGSAMKIKSALYSFYLKAFSMNVSSSFQKIV